jgi:hypothetical protein
VPNSPRSSKIWCRSDANPVSCNWGLRSRYKSTVCASVGSEYGTEYANTVESLFFHFSIALTDADNIYISAEHTFHRRRATLDTVYSVKITFLCCKTESRFKNIAPKLTKQRCRLESLFIKKLWKLKDETYQTQSHAHKTYRPIP